MKYYNDESLSIKLQLKNERRELFIYTRGAHGLLKEGAPSGGNGLPSVGEGRHFSTSIKQVSIKSQMKERAPLPLTMGCHLKRAPPLQEGRTSFPTCAQISKDNQSIANQLDLVPFDHLIDFAIKFSPNLSPFILFLF
jgi:hypothetical protein